MLSAEKVQPETFRQFGGMVFATFLLPLAFLYVDYAFRSQASLAEFEELVLQSGPDCCIFSLGATGAIFADEHVRAIPGLGSSSVALLVVAIVFALRFYCVGAARKKDAHRSLLLGLASILLLMVIPAVAFIAKRYFL